MKITESAMKKIVKVLENATPVFTVTIYNVRLENEGGEYRIQFEDGNNYTHSIYFYGNDSVNIQFGVFDEKGFYRWFADGDITKCTIYDVVFIIAAKINELDKYVEDVVIPHDWAEYHAEPETTTEPDSTTEPETTTEPDSTTTEPETTTEPDSTTTEPETTTEPDNTEMIEYIMNRIESACKRLVWKHKHKVMYYFDAHFEVLADLIYYKYTKHELTEIQREFLLIYLQDRRYELESMGLQ